jgi:hypothetical protein
LWASVQPESGLPARLIIADTLAMSLRDAKRIAASINATIDDLFGARTADAAEFHIGRFPH